MLFIRLEDESHWLQPGVGEEASPLEYLKLQWLLSGKTAAVTGQGMLGDLLQFLQTERGDLFDLKVALVLQGTRVINAQVAIPARQARQIQQALPFMLEDQLAEDVDQFHLVIQKRSRSGEVPVVLCLATELAQLVAHFNHAGLPLDAVIPDMYCVPPVEGGWAFVTDGRQLLIRQSDQQALAIELDALPIVMASLLGGSEQPPQEIRVQIVGESMSASLENWMRTQITSYVADQPVNLVVDHIHEPLLKMLTEPLRIGLERSAWNLLQGHFKPLARQQSAWFNWKPLAALLVVALGLHLGFQWAQASRLQTAALSLEQESVALYKRYFPADRQTTNLKRRIESKLQQGSVQGAQAGFLVLLTQFGEQQHNLNAGGQRITPTRISFDNKQGDLRIDMLAASFADLDQLKSKLAAARLEMDIASASNEGDKVRARVTIKGASS